MPNIFYIDRNQSIFDQLDVDDFSKSELEKAKLADFQFVSLGENRLRAETAGMMACAIFSMIK